MATTKKPNNGITAPTGTTSNTNSSAPVGYSPNSVADLRNKLNQYDVYTESQATSDARNKLNGLEYTKPGKFDGGLFQTQLLANMQDINNRQPFVYNMNSDQLYQQYKDQYTRLGESAMADTIAQASSLTGGYGNSWATSAGSQAYQGYLQQLNDKIPELYKLALDKYQMEGQELYNKYGILSDAYNREYNQYRDTVDDWYKDYANAENRYYNEANMSWNQFDSNRNYAFNRYTDTRDYQHTLDRDRVSDYQWTQNFNAQNDQFNRNLALQYAQLGETKRSNMANEAYRRATLAASNAGANGSGSSASSSGAGTGQAVGAGQSANTSNFIANNMTRNEFTARGNSSSEYNNYIMQKIQKGYNNNSLSQSEAAYLMMTYGLR